MLKEGQWPTGPCRVGGFLNSPHCRTGRSQERKPMGSWEIPSLACLAKQQGVPQEPPIVGHFRPGSWGFHCRQKIKTPTPYSSVFKGSVSQWTNNVL